MAAGDLLSWVRGKGRYGSAGMLFHPTPGDALTEFSDGLFMQQFEQQL